MSYSRKFSLDRLLKQLNDSPIQKRLEELDKTRVFDLPKKFNCIFADTEHDIERLITVLQTITDVNDPDKCDIPGFTYRADNEKIKKWAKPIINHACHVLLENNNKEIKPIVLRFMNKSAAQLSAYDLIYSFFAITSQHLMVQLNTIKNIDNIKQDVFQGFAFSLNHAENWIEECGPIKPKQDIINGTPFAIATGLTLGVGLFIGGVAVAYASRKTTSFRRKDDTYYNSPPPSPDFLKKR